MLGACWAIDPPCYRMADIPRLLQRATAQLHDGTIVHPFMSGDEETFLSLSGILFVGSAADQRCVLHEHLKNLGLAGPDISKRDQNTHALPFRSLAMLPAELLAIPIPTTSCAFEEVPVMSLREWEEYRRRSTSTVLPMPTRCTWFRNHPMIADQISVFLHEWRRCVCRLCASHLSRVNRELPARLRPNRERKKHKQAPDCRPNQCHLISLRLSLAAGLLTDQLPVQVAA